MPFRLTDADERKLVGVSPLLVGVVRRAAEITDEPFMVIEGLRSLERQRLLVKQGKSWTMRSKHLVGNAVDIAPLVNGKPFWYWTGGFYDRLADVMKLAARDRQVPVTWGGDWTKRDGPHWELK